MKILVAMSGGVDSSVAAAILQQQGHEVIGVSMHLHDHAALTGKSFGKCCSPLDVQDARSVCQKLAVPFYVMDLTNEFQQKVIDDFVDSYAQGRTPSPCIHCNSYLKFSHLWRKGRILGVDAIATGHYARIRKGDGDAKQLWRSLYHEKDQSYFLFGLGQKALRRTIFPLGDLRKKEVRGIAKDLGFSNAEKPESQEICFIPDGNYRSFLGRHDLKSAGQEGPICDRQGRVIGKHQGTYGFTVGQRRGLGVAVGEPLYVLEVQPSERRLVVGKRQETYSDSCRVDDVHWIEEHLRNIEELSCEIQIRHRHQPASGRIVIDADQKSRRGGARRIIFDQPQHAVTPGQAAVFYHGDHVLGGGWIDSAIPSSVDS